MPVYRLSAEPGFPEPEEAEPDGLLAVGGDLGAERLLLAYSRGIFPWYERPPILWFSPDPRAALHPSELHVSRRLGRTLRKGRYTLRMDSAFGEVIRLCASIRRDERGTWITPEMIDAYEQLHALGFAHSAEAWSDDRLVGGVYGVSLGAAFFGESMFHLEPDASKVALAALCRQLHAWGFELVDAQIPNAHLTRMGVRPWPRTQFLSALERAVAKPTLRGPWSFEPGIVEEST